MNILIVFLVFSSVSIFVSGQVSKPTKATIPTTSKFTTPSTKPTTSKISTTTPTPRAEWCDPYVGGKYANPGAIFQISNKTIGQIHSFVAEKLAGFIQNMSMDDLNVAMGSAVLTIKSPRITESKFSNVDYELIPSNRIRSNFFNGRFLANGVWQYKPSGSVHERGFVHRALNGMYRITIVNGQLESLVQLMRTFDAKPTAQTIRCETNFSQFRIDIEGAGNHSLIENCDDRHCDKIRTYFADAACQAFRSFLKNLVNQQLSTFPTTIDTFSKNQKIYYGLLNNQPEVTEFDIQAGLEGKALWYNLGGQVPFLPNPINFVDRNRMVTFALSDYSLNTLFYQPHSQGYRYSAVDLLSKSPSINDMMKLNCSSSNSKSGAGVGIGIGTSETRKQQRKPWSIGSSISGSSRSMCLGSMLQNMTNADQQQQFDFSHTGDFVYKSGQRAPSIFVQSSSNNGRNFFDASNGILEMYGPVNFVRSDQDQRRQLLARVDVRVLRGEFVPKLNGANITGSIKITDLDLVQSSIQTRSIGDDWLSQLTEFAQPILTDMFNSFLDRFAQFEIPLLDGYQCMSPELFVSDRSMQISCDVRCIEK